MSDPSKHDELTAEILEGMGNAAAGIAGSFGHAMAGTAAKAIMHAAAEAIRRRGVTTDQLVVSLRHVSPLDMPWGADK
jgi:hypothetical protein